MVGGWLDRGSSDSSQGSGVYEWLGYSKGWNVVVGCVYGIWF